MTAVTFFTDGRFLTGFRIVGHSSDSEKDVEGKIVCAAVSSAAYMTANTATEVLKATADAEVSDGEMTFRILDSVSETQGIMNGFRLHITELAKQYPKRIKVISEV